MPNFCIPLEKVTKLKESVMALSKQSQLDALVKMDPIVRVNFLKKTLTDEEAVLLNHELDKAIASEKLNALRDWVKQNLSKEYRQNKLNAAQKNVLDIFLNKKTIAKNRISKSIDEIVSMPEKEREVFLSNYLNKEDVIKFQEFVAKKSEDIAKNKLNALEAEIHTVNRDFKDIKAVDDFIALKMEKLADEKLGLGLSEEEIKKFTELGKDFFIKSEAMNKGNILDNKEKYFEAAEAWEKLVEYSEEIKPRSLWRAWVMGVGRASMLASIKSPLLNIESNLVSGFTESISRRLAQGRLYGAVDKEVVKDYSKSAVALFDKTNIDLSRMIKLDEPITGTGKIVGEESSRTGFAVADNYVDFIYNTTLTKPDVRFANFAFSDSANLISSRIAKGDSKRATEIFKDAVSLNPKTEEGKLVRTQAIIDARRATYTNDTLSSKTALEFRKFLNNVPGLGDISMPFVKTVSNVAELGIDYAGVGIIKGGVGAGGHLYFAKMKGTEIDREAMRDYFRSMVRGGIGLTTATVIVSQIDIDDFMGAYDPARHKINQLSNTVYNSVKFKTPFGDKWVSMDYFGVIAPTMVGMLYAKKYGDTATNSAISYLSGLASEYVSQNPMFTPFTYIAGEIGKIDKINIETTKKLFGDTIPRDAFDMLVSRTVPGIINDLAKATDEYQRETKSDKYNIAGFGIDSFVNKLPYFRQTLPVKYNILGRTMYEEGWSTVLFGARVKTDTSDKIVKEIRRLDSEGQIPAIKDLSRSNSKKVEELKKKVGEEKFRNILVNFGSSQASAIEKTMNTGDYKRADDEDKKKIIDDAINKEYKKLLDKYNIKYGQ